MFAFLVLSAVRIESLISLKVGSIDINKQLIKQRIKEGVSTKFSKNIDSFYFPLPSKEFKQVFENWYNYITLELGYKQNYALFPKAHITLNDDLFFTQQGFGKKPKHFTSTTQGRKIIQECFNVANYSFNPHSVRHSIAHLGEQTCTTAEQMKAWSQNLGHSSIDTTFSSYGTVSISRVKEVLGKLGR